MNADVLREAMVDALWEMGTIRSERVAAAFLAVPRQVFAAGRPLEEVYAARDAVITKRDERGVAISSVSAPEIQAFMLEQADIRPGMSVLEIGSGGYNAALLAELVGTEGAVTTVDIDPEVTARARRCLDSAGYARVSVVTADAEHGVPEHAPYDRILVTVGAWDLPPTWTEQLAANGRIVAPLRMRGLTRSLALDRDGDRLVSRSVMLCGFVKMQGAGAHEERLLPLRGKEIALRFDDSGPAEPHLLDGVLDTERAQTWTGVTVGRQESFDTLQLWLASTMPGFCMLDLDSEHAAGLLAPGIRCPGLATVAGDSFAYVVSRPAGDQDVEFGTHAFGLNARAVADMLAERIRAWDRGHRRGPGPTVTVWPRDTPGTRLWDGVVIDKRHSRVTISWPNLSMTESGGGSQHGR